MSKMAFKLDQKKILFQDSLHNIGGSTVDGITAYNAADSLLYYDYLVQQGIIDRSFEEFYPLQAGRRGFAQAICLNLSACVDPTIEETRESHFYVDIEWATGAYAPSQTRAILISVKEHHIHRTADGSWDMKPN